MTFSTRKVKRLAAAVLILFFISLASFGRAQNGYSLDVKDTPLGSALKLIQKKTGYNFVYFQEDVLKYKTSFSVQHASMDQVMQACLKNIPISFSIDNKIVSLRVTESMPDPGTGDEMITVRGHVQNEKGEPLVGANVIVKGRDKATTTDDRGDFHIDGVASNATLFVTYVGYSGEEIKVNRKTWIDIKMQRNITALEDVNLEYSNGYQTIPKERATGSFVFVDNALLDRSVSPDILSRFNGVVSGMLNLNTNPTITGATSSAQGIYIRGLSTINANTVPLVVIDNFPYDGDLNNINPDDIESATILKDAAAASIWGVRAGNGVIVITTKKGARNRSAHLSFNTNITFTGRPNLFYAKTMSSSDYIDLETLLYNQGFYSNLITSPSEPALDPVLETLVQESNGQISPADAEQRINGYRKLDIRNDASKFLYQKDLDQQYSLNLSGGNRDDQYYVSAGMNNRGGNGSFLKRNEYRRVSVDVSNICSLFDHKLDISTSIYYVNGRTESNGMPLVNMSVPYPYAQLRDASGDNLSIPKYNPGYTDTAGQGHLLNWDYIPLDELNAADNSSIENEYRIDVGLKYRLPWHFVAEVKYQYGALQSDIRDLQSLQTFNARDLINSFTEINWTNGAVTYPVPVGAILNRASNSYTFQNFRPQLSFSNAWNGKHQLSAIAGAEIRDASSQGYNTVFYGYDGDHMSSVPVDEVGLYPNYITGSYSSIPSGQSLSATDNRFISYFANIAYTYLGRYTLSGSGRNDGSNLFGVNTNQKHVPLWSSGLAWDISKEPFYHIDWLPELKFRATYGYQGNLSNNLSALLTTEYTGNNQYGAPESQVANPPNPNLRWEKVAQENLGVDFSTRDTRISGSLEFYVKKGKDLIGPEPIAPSLGLPSFNGNTANMRGEGFDLTLNTKNIVGRFQWATSMLLSYNTDHVTHYGAVNVTNSSFIVGNGITPIIGKPVRSVFAYQWAGLDSVGNPMGYLNGKVSEDYSNIENLADPTKLKYIGHAMPKFFGSIRNEFSYKQFSLSFNLVYKFDYYFRRTSLNYYQLFNYGYYYGVDYGKRWQNPGDEKRTDVPSLIYPANSSRDNFYLGSEVLVDRGDEIRLQDFRLSYTLSSNQLRGTRIQGVDIYFYANNLFLLWKANHDGIDPDAVPSNGGYSYFPYPKSFSLGAKLEL